MARGWQARATLGDVAARAGVSKTTASVALNDKRDGIRVTDDTRERVRAAAAELGYTPNAMARDLRARRSRTIGFLSEDVTTTPFAVGMLDAAQKEASRSGHLLSIVQLDEGGSSEAQWDAIDLLRQQQVAGIVYATMYHRVLAPPPGLPDDTVFLNCRAAEGNFISIVPDEYQGAFAAVTELLEHGHRRIGFLDDSEHHEASTLRRQGYMDALAAYGLEANPRLCVEDLSYARGGKAIEPLLDLPPSQRPTGLFCYNDRQAMGAYRAIRKRGLTIPRDISVVGFDDQEYIASELDPPLTTMQVPHRAMGAMAIHILLQNDSVPAASPAHERTPGVRLVPVPIIRRDSVGPPP
jgi:LacI family transcriptional regulator